VHCRRTTTSRSVRVDSKLDSSIPDADRRREKQQARAIQENPVPKPVLTTNPQIPVPHPPATLVVQTEVPVQPPGRAASNTRTRTHIRNTPGPPSLYTTRVLRPPFRDENAVPTSAPRIKPPSSPSTYRGPQHESPYKRPLFP
jgi:hypothetical protein